MSTGFPSVTGRAFPGRWHDYALLKAEFPPEEVWFEDIEALLDSGYQGIQKDYQGDRRKCPWCDCIRIPHKKPRKSKCRPNPQLSEEQKRENRALAKLRVFIEHAIGGIKRYQILVTPIATTGQTSKMTSWSSRRVYGTSGSLEVVQEQL